jgi:hypothetical protein
MIKKNIFFVIILLFFITILFYNYFSTHNIESFSLFSSDKKTDTSTTITNSDTKKSDTTNSDIKKSEDRYKYFKIVSDYNRFSDETREAIRKIVKGRKTNESDSYVEEIISEYERYGSEEEAKIFIETGQWPFNNYIKENIKMFVKNNEAIKEEDKDKLYNSYISEFSKIGPVSHLLFIYPLFPITQNMKKEDLVGQAKFIFNSNQKSEKDKFYCYSRRDNNGNPTTTPKINDIEIEKENYPSLENTIPGFKFLQKPCDPCTNRCTFSYDGVVAAPYARYWGVSSQTGKATPEEIKT